MAHIVSIDAMRALAKARVPRPIFDVIDKGAETGWTLARNTASFDRRAVAPRCLVDVSRPDTTVRVLGLSLDWPVICSPVGGLGMFDPGGELALARAATRTGTAFAVSTAASQTLEAIAEHCAVPRIFQLYPCRSRELTFALIERARRAGYGALCVTVDTLAFGKCEAEWASGIFRSARTWPLATFAALAARPAWTIRQWLAAPVRVANLTDAGGAACDSARFAQMLAPTIDWRHIRDIADAWGGPLAVKGIARGDDALRAIDAGASAVVVSNHGGRQLDGQWSPFDALDEIAGALAGRAEVVLDGGVRRGTHVLKALARGANACFCGRAWLYGLAAAGEAGAEHSLRILRSEFQLAMQLAGCASIEEIDADLLRVVC